MQVRFYLSNLVKLELFYQLIYEKYTHEIWVDRRGHYKYDRWKQQQDFEQIPDNWFQAYDEMRQSLADEIFIAIDDIIARTEVDSILERLQPQDIQLLRLIHDRGELTKYILKKDLGEEGRMAAVRLKARNLIVPVKVSSNKYNYAMTNLAVAALNALNNNAKKEQTRESSL